MRSLRSYIGWGIFFSLVAIIIQALPSPTATYYFFKGKQHFYSGDLQGAANAYQAAVNADPTFARGFVELGVSYYWIDKYPEAEASFKTAMAIKADSCASCGLGMVYRSQGRKSEAEAALRQSIDLDPNDACPYNQLGRLYYDDEKYDKAIEIFQQEIRLHPSAISYHFLGNSLHHSGNVEKSIEPYLQSRRLDPEYENVLVDLGATYHELGREQEATEALARAVKLKPNDQKARAYLGITKYVTGDRTGAMEQYNWLRQKNPQLANEMLRGFNELAGSVRNRSEATEKPKDN